MQVQPWAVVSCLALALVACSSRQTVPTGPVPSQPMLEETVLSEAEAFFGQGAYGVADLLNRVFSENNGPPTAYIIGEEGTAALGLGLRYGHGTVYLSDGTTSRVYWRGPSVGIDLGGSAAKAFILVYGLERIEDLYQRFGGVEGSLYVVGGVSVNYNRLDDIVLAPVRFGLGWRGGVSVGYLHLSPDSSWNPF